MQQTTSTPQVPSSRQNGWTIVYWIGVVILISALIAIVIDLFMPQSQILSLTMWFKQKFTYSWIETVGLLILPIGLFILLENKRKN